MDDSDINSAALIPEKIKSRLYQAVLDLFSNNDYHQVNIRIISRMSGLSTGTIYKYFTSKEELIFTLIEEKIAEIIELSKIHIQEMETTREVCRKLFWVLMDYYDRNPGVAITFFITVPTKTWMQKKSYLRVDSLDIIRESLNKGRKLGELDPALSDSRIISIFYMHCYREVQIWYYKGMKWKLVDSIPGFFPIFWKTISSD